MADQHHTPCASRSAASTRESSLPAGFTVVAVDQVLWFERHFPEAQSAAEHLFKYMLQPAEQRPARAAQDPHQAELSLSVLSSASGCWNRPATNVESCAVGDRCWKASGHSPGRNSRTAPPPVGLHLTATAGRQRREELRTAHTDEQKRSGSLVKAGPSSLRDDPRRQRSCAITGSKLAHHRTGAKRTTGWKRNCPHCGKLSPPSKHN